MLTGTPKYISNHLETVFSQSTANEWTIPCGKCDKGVILDECSLDPAGPSVRVAAARQPQDGHWVARNPNARWGAGFWVNHAMVPWLDYDEIVDRQRIYDLAKFKNEVLGLPTTTGDHVATREELEAPAAIRTRWPSRRKMSRRKAGRI